MTGNRAFSCLFCRILRVIEINRRITHLNHLRFSRVAGCINTTQTFSTSAWLQDKTKDSNPGAGSGYSDSSSEDGSSSSSSDSDSDSDKEMGDKPAPSGGQAVTPDLMSLLTKMKASENKWGSKENVESKLKDIEDSIDSKLVTEAVKLSQELPGDKAKSESALIGQLLTQFATTANQRKGAAPTEEGSKANDLSAILGGISIDKGYKKQRKDKGERKESHDDYIEEEEKSLTFRSGGVGLFSGTPLGIFTQEDMKSARTERRSLFEIVEEEKKKELEFYPPQNAFEEQIQWTKEGKLWTFPINNEAGWESEMKVDYTEHVFLEPQLDGFPTMGPIRHFMELVITGLGKNPYLTIEQKHETIEWYREYFKSKEELLEATLGKEGQIREKSVAQ